MKHRTVLPEKERRACSRATRLIHDKPLMVGGLGEMARTSSADYSGTKFRARLFVASSLPCSWTDTNQAGSARCCCSCLVREIRKASGIAIQYSYRNATAILLCVDFVLPLDLAPQRPGEEEVAAATRLLKRFLADHPRAFAIVIADGLYARAPFFKMVQEHGKQVMAVLEDDRRDLFQDARSVFKRSFFGRGPLPGTAGTAKGILPGCNVANEGI